jgi:hypothetical protein
MTTSSNLNIHNGSYFKPAHFNVSMNKSNLNNISRKKNFNTNHIDLSLTRNVQNRERLVDFEDSVTLGSKFTNNNNNNNVNNGTRTIMSNNLIQMSQIGHQNEFFSNFNALNNNNTNQKSIYFLDENLKIKKKKPINLHHSSLFDTKALNKNETNAQVKLPNLKQFERERINFKNREKKFFF